MSGLWQKIKQGVHQSASVAAEKAEEFGRIGKQRLDIANAKREINRAHAELGATVYRLWEKERDPKIMNQAEVQGFMDQIKALEADLREKEAEMERMKASPKTEAAESSASETV